MLLSPTMFLYTTCLYREEGRKRESQEKIWELMKTCLDFIEENEEQYGEAT